MSYDLMIYDNLTNPYMRLVQVPTGKQYDFVNDVLVPVTTAAASYSDTCLTLTKNAYSLAAIIIEIDEYVASTGLGLPPGRYDLLLYDAATKATSDNTQIAKRIEWDGNNIFGLPQDL